MTDAREALVAVLWEKFGAWPNGPLAAWLTEADCARVADAILAAGWTPPGEDQWWESLVEAPCDRGHRIFIDDGDGGVYACPVCALLPTVKPSVEDVARALAELNEDTDWEGGVESYLPDARAALALFPGRTESEVKAEALREVAPGCNCEDDYAWLNDRADRIEKEANHG